MLKLTLHATSYDWEFLPGRRRDVHRQRQPGRPRRRQHGARRRQPSRSAPASPTTSQTLTADGRRHDADGDTLTTAYQWTKNGTDIAGATGATLNLATAGNGDRGDVIRVRATVVRRHRHEQPRHLQPGDRRQRRPDRHGRPEPGEPDDEPDAHRDRDQGRRRRRPRHADVRVERRHDRRQDDASTSSLTDTLDLATAGNGDAGDTRHG